MAAVEAALGRIGARLGVSASEAARGIVRIANNNMINALKLVSLWKSTDLKSPGNILVVPQRNGPSRIYVVDEWKSVAEVSPDGKVVATHKPDLQDKELICSLRTAVGSDGKRQFAAFAQTGQRFFWFDENWRPLLSFPDDALKNPHTGIADVQLGDMDGDGRLKAYVGYYGAAGVQAVSIEGNRIWSNRTLASVVRTAFGPPDAQGRRDLLCANENGRLAVLDTKGDVRDNITALDWPLAWIVGADLMGDGRLLWCSLSANQETGQTVILGLSLKGELLWNYPIPKGMPRQPIEPISVGKLVGGGPGVWILPGCDGSIHFVSADGKPIDQFNYGATLGGVATVELGGKPVLIIASENGLEALRIE